jgi:hypothetical protein
MHVFKSLADIAARLTALIVGTPAEPQRALTEDDLRSESYLRRQRGLNAQ